MIIFGRTPNSHDTYNCFSRKKDKCQLSWKWSAQIVLVHSPDPPRDHHSQVADTQSTLLGQPVPRWQTHSALCILCVHSCIHKRKIDRHGRMPRCRSLHSDKFCLAIYRRFLLVLNAGIYDRQVSQRWNSQLTGISTFRRTRSREGLADPEVEGSLRYIMRPSLITKGGRCKLMADYIAVFNIS